MNCMATPLVVITTLNLKHVEQKEKTVQGKLDTFLVEWGREERGRRGKLKFNRVK